jgi:hypothetical protein
MEVLKFIFILGINFSIFGFIWGIIMFFVRSLQPRDQQSKDSFTYAFRIIKYFLLVSVTANFITVYEAGEAGEQLDNSHIIIGSLVLGLYLLGKFQNRAVLNQFANNPMFARLMPKVDPKVELVLLIGSIAYFIACLLVPSMVNNGLINWFTNSIISIYETPIIGWVFQIIAFFFLLSIITRAANVLGRILQGQSIMTKNTNEGGAFNFNASGTNFEEEQDRDEDENGFTDFEDVTDQEENKDE